MRVGVEEEGHDIFNREIHEIRERENLFYPSFAYLVYFAV
jgi:DNA-binding transcriptional regulator YiaG